jgi:hypothetical protein
MVLNAGTDPQRNYEEWVAYLQQNSTARITTSVMRTAKRDAEVRLQSQGKTLTEPNRANGYRWGETDDQLAYWLEARPDLTKLVNWMVRLITNGDSCGSSNATISQATSDVLISLQSLPNAIDSELAALLASESDEDSE